MANTVQQLARGKRQVAAARFKEAAQVRNVWSVVPEEGTPFETVQRQDYWAHVAAKLRPGDLIEVHAEDGAYFARLLVRTQGRVWAVVKVLEFHDFSADAAAPARDPGHDVKWKGPHLKWAVIRQSDLSVVHGGFENKAMATAWLAEYLQQVAA